MEPEILVEALVALLVNFGVLNDNILELLEVELLGLLVQPQLPEQVLGISPEYLRRVYALVDALLHLQLHVTPLAVFILLGRIVVLVAEVVSHRVLLDNDVLEADIILVGAQAVQTQVGVIFGVHAFFPAWDVGE